jgi:hypothetical protein
MSANRLFLVCSAHPSIEDAFCIADRNEAGGIQSGQYFCAGNCRCLKCKCADKYRERMGDFFIKHAGCGMDHYQLAYHRQKGWDISPPAQDTVAGVVRLALVNGTQETEH